MNSSCLASCARRLVFAALFSLHTAALAVAAPVPPNIVLIIGDDHAWRDVGFLGHAVALTPNLDALAAAGTVFTNAHNTASACQPSLQTLLSGMHPVQWDARPARQYAHRLRLRQWLGDRAVLDRPARRQEHLA
ncbi:MAG: sulfatase-like hydrolase/transferase [Deltaproteobacteria bacterium]